MVVGAFAAMVSAPGFMTAVSNREEGTRASATMDSLLDENPNEQVNNLQTTLTEQENFEVPSLVEDPNGVSGPVEANRVEITNVESEGTRSPGVDAGGPYGGPSTFEGATITFTATVDDPALMFFRWDFNGDGEFDTPWIFSPGMSHSIDWVYEDDFYGDVLVEAWDGFSMYVVVISGNILGEALPYWYYNPYTWWIVGWKFRAEASFDIIRLGRWRDTSMYSYDASIWQVDNEQLLGYCYPAYVYNAWRWCSRVIPIEQGKEYIIAVRSYRQPRGRNWDDFTTPEWITIDKNTLHYRFTSGRYFPNVAQSPWPVATLVDFQASGSYTVYITESDTAYTTVNNIAPTAGGVQSVEAYGYEGSPINVYGEFSDPGTADDWQYRMDWGDGSISDWFPVQKLQGGVKVMFAYTWTANFNAWYDSFVDQCAEYCVEVYRYDAYSNGPPSLEEMVPYDAVVVGGDYIMSTAFANEFGDVIADYLDAGGDVIQMTFSINTVYPMFLGRYVSDEYTPVERAAYGYYTTSLGTVYVPGHPIFDGVSSIGPRYQEYFTSLTPGATRVADWANGYIGIAEKPNPIVANDAMVMALNFLPYEVSYGVTGDSHQMLVNALRYTTDQPWPTVKPMPIQLDPIGHIYEDDNPSTTPYDEYTVTLEVKDDDHGRVIVAGTDTIYTNNFQSYPSDWSLDSQWTWGYDTTGGLNSYCLMNWYYMMGEGSATSPSFDMSAYMGAAFGWRHWWDSSWPFGTQDGYVEASADGGATWPYLLAEFHDGDPLQDLATYDPIPVPIGMGKTDVKFRFRVNQNDDWWWMVDDVIVQGVIGQVVEGLGTASGTVTIYNVEPVPGGGTWGPGASTEGSTFTYEGITIDDPAFGLATEWFAYQWYMDDGITQPWHYVGVIPPQTAKVLIVHCLDSTTEQVNFLSALETVESIDTWDLLNTRVSPTTSELLQYDVVMWFAYRGAFDTGWITVREIFGNNVADYMDQGGGFINFSPGLADNNLEIWRMMGRYVEDGYTPAEVAYDPWNTVTLGEVFYPEHPIMKDVNELSTTGARGQHEPTIGGANNAAGVDGVVICDWSNGNHGVVVKELLNGARTIFINQARLQYLTGGDWEQLVSNSVRWILGPAFSLPAFNFIFGDNGVYNVDLMMIDDDMGWTGWDFINNEPIPSPDWTPTIKHNYAPVSIDNVDPLLFAESIEVFIAADFCLRVSGESWHKVTLTTYMDGTVFGTTEVVRQPGDPNDQAKCTMLRIDMMMGHDFAYEVNFDPFMDPDLKGSNPTWVIISPHKEPITPGHGTVTHKYDFNAKEDPSTWTLSVDLPTIKQDLLASGHGAKIGFEATAYDPGTDDLAFVWIWGDSTPYGINIHNNHDFSVTDGVSAEPENVGFYEPPFDKLANTVKSPHGNHHFWATDEAYHGFEMGYYYFVVVIVMDDDVDDPYPSPYGHPGVDMEFIGLDLR